jgi:RHH-type transcriptional regulator, rel operon repressor / antitoxin RelB
MPLIRKFLRVPSGLGGKDGRYSAKAECSHMLNLFNMLGIRLEPELEKKLDSLARETGRSKSYYAREAIRQYLEDREDYLKGMAVLERREPTISLDELERRLGLAE